MKDSMQNIMAEATRLVGEGHLLDATAAIQRALGGGPMSSGPSGAPFGGPSGTSGRAEGSPLSLPAAPPRTRPSRRAFRRKADGEQSPRVPRMPDLKGLLNVPEMPDLQGLRVGGSPTGPAVVPDGGQFLDRSFTNAAGTRDYKLYVPSGYDGQKEVPLVVMLHGCTQDPNDFAAGTRMNIIAEERTFLVLYPAQSGRANSSRCWNWFKGTDQERGRGEPSIIAGITCEILGEYNVAPDRVYVAGMSAGGAMAAILGSAYPDLYAAVGVHSGLAPGAAHDLPSALSAMHGKGANLGGRRPGSSAAGTPERDVPLIVFHGDRDGTVHSRNAEAVVSHYQPAGQAGRPIRVRQGTVPDGYSYTRSTHQDADGRPVMEQWTVHGLAHAWSGGGRPGSYTDPKGPDASAEMVRFFDEHRL